MNRKRSDSLIDLDGTPELEETSCGLFYELNRLRTFNNKWPHTFINVKILARTGFYYTGNEDRVKCVFCKVELSKWMVNDNELFEHLKWSPNCSLLRRQEIRNVPIDPIELCKSLSHNSYDECGILSDRFSVTSRCVIKSTSSSLSIECFQQTFFINDSKSLAFIFNIGKEKQEQFKLQNMNTNMFIRLNKQKMKELCLSIRRYFNVNVEYPDYHKTRAEMLTYIFPVNQYTSKIEIDFEQLTMLTSDLANILDIEPFMFFLYSNYLD